jgi:transcriptional regulator with XRE-family HTH domain
MAWNAEKVRQVLTERGHTRKWLASQCGIDVGTLHHILNGRQPGRPVIKLLALALGVPEESLFTGAHEPISAQTVSRHSKSR